MLTNYTPRQDRLRGSPFTGQAQERSLLGTVIKVCPETFSCQVKGDDGSIYDSLPFPNLEQDSQGGGGEVCVPRNGQRVELKLGGPLGTRIRGLTATPFPGIVSESASPDLFPAGLPANQRGRVNFRGLMPKNLVAGDWCRVGNQGQYLGVLDGGVAALFGSPWSRITAVGGSNTDTLEIVGRRLNVITAFGNLKVKSDNGRHSVELSGGLDQQTETGSDRERWTYHGGLGTREGFSFFSVTTKSGDPIYRVNVGYDGGYDTFCSGNYSLTTLGVSTIRSNKDFARVVGGGDHLEVRGGDRVEKFLRNRTCQIDINDQLFVMGNATQSVQGNRTVTCKVLTHNVSGEVTSKPGDTSYKLNVANGSWDIDIGKPPADLAKSMSSYNLTVHSPKGSINFKSIAGAISLQSTLGTSIKARTTLDLTATGIATLSGSVVKLGGSGANQPVLKGTTVISQLQSCLAKIAVAGNGAIPDPSALSTALHTIGAAAQSLTAQLSGWASTKVFTS